jgi:tRNA (adenine37-N6)-methyltransferase
VPYVFEPIGVARSPFVERVEAPRQAALAAGVAGRIELVPGCDFEHALEGLEGWEWVWVIFVFHKNVEQERGWKPKVLPPRSETKQGVFATRSPHRPNPIGMSALRLDRVEGRVLHVRGIDLLDGTPVLDIKPYVAYADSHPDARAGWLETPDPRAAWSVEIEDAARAQLEWLRSQGADLRPAIESALSLGPQPNAYRRIRKLPGTGNVMTLALKEWRVDFAVEAERRALRVVALRSGYRPRQIATDESLALHRAFAVAFR